MDAKKALDYIEKRFANAYTKWEETRRVIRDANENEYLNEAGRNTFTARAREDWAKFAEENRFDQTYDEAMQAIADAAQAINTRANILRPEMNPVIAMIQANGVTPEIESSICGIDWTSAEAKSLAAIAKSANLPNLEMALTEISKSKTIHFNQANDPLYYVFAETNQGKPFPHEAEQLMGEIIGTAETIVAATEATSSTAE